MTEEEMYDELGEIGGQTLIDSPGVTETRESHKRVTTLTYSSGWVMSRSDKSGRDEILVTNDGRTVWFGISDTIPFEAELWAELRAYFKRTPNVVQDDVQRIVFRRQDVLAGVEPEHKELPPPVAKLKPLQTKPKPAPAKEAPAKEAPEQEAPEKPAKPQRRSKRQIADTALALGLGAAVVMVLAKVVPPVIQAVQKGMR